VRNKTVRDLYRSLTLSKNNSKKEAVEENQANSNKFIFEKNHVLKGIVKSQKIKKLKNNFIQKISRTSTAR